MWSNAWYCWTKLITKNFEQNQFTQSFHRNIPNRILRYYQLWNFNLYFKNAAGWCVCLQISCLRDLRFATEAVSKIVRPWQPKLFHSPIIKQKHIFVFKKMNAILTKYDNRTFKVYLNIQNQVNIKLKYGVFYWKHSRTMFLLVSSGLIINHNFSWLVGWLVYSTK